MRDRFAQHPRRGRGRGLRGRVQPGRPEALAAARPRDREPLMAQIEDYALIGDLQTAALVERRGSIDWLCFPRFDSGACFAALLGGPKTAVGFSRPWSPRRATRRYLHDTLVLETTWETRERLASASSTSCRRAGRRRTSCASSRVSRERPNAFGARSSASTTATSCRGSASGRRRTRASPSPARTRCASARLRRRAARTCARSPSPRSTRASGSRSCSRGSLARGRAGGDRPRQSRSRRPRASGANGTQACPLDAAGDWREAHPTLAHRAEGAHLRPRPAGSSPRRRPRCPSTSAACATGTTASAGSATRR